MMIIRVALVLAALLACPPQGVVNPEVTQGNIHETICVPGWTRTVRPPAYVTEVLKITQMLERGLPGPAHLYEEDHWIPLELGGHPTDPDNLWPQPYLPIPGAHEKDQVENYLHREVCAGRMTLAEAQAAIPDWEQVWREHFAP